LFAGSKQLVAIKWNSGKVIKATRTSSLLSNTVNHNDKKPVLLANLKIDAMFILPEWYSMKLSIANFKALHFSIQRVSDVPSALTCLFS
jgi:hypothetical protein